MRRIMYILALALCTTFCLAYTNKTTELTNETCENGEPVQLTTITGHYDGTPCGDGYTCPGGVEFDGGRYKPADAMFTVTSYADDFRYFDGGSGLNPETHNAGLVFSKPLREWNNVFTPWYVDKGQYIEGDTMYVAQYTTCTQVPPAEVPEYSTIIAGITLIGATSLVIKKRIKKE